MVKLLIGTKGTGKTKKMIEMANQREENSNGSVVFINKNHRLMYDLNHNIRVVCMNEYENITNIDEYVGFLFGIISSNHDIEVVFIDSILKQTDVKVEDIPSFLDRLRGISEKYEKEFVVSLSIEKEELGHMSFEKFEIIN